MDTNLQSEISIDKGLLRMAGIAGILVGVFILTFAIVGESNKILFFDPVFEGGSVEPWIRNIQASPSLARFITVLPILGFSCMFVVSVVLYRYIPENSWQKNLSIVGYAIGVPVAVVTFASHLSLIDEVLLLYGGSEAMDGRLEAIASVRLYYFGVINHVIGPFFVVIIGTSMMAWAALKKGTLPKWICIWLMSCGALVSISFIGFWVPVLRVTGIAAPLHMLGFFMLGVILLRRSFSK